MNGAQQALRTAARKLSTPSPAFTTSAAVVTVNVAMARAPRRVLSGLAPTQMDVASKAW
jgi:hypothetical protein